MTAATGAATKASADLLRSVTCEKTKVLVESEVKGEDDQRKPGKVVLVAD